MNLRIIGLAAVVVTATLVPLAASAGPAGTPTPVGRSGQGPAARAEGGVPDADAALLPGLGAVTGDGGADPAGSDSPGDAHAGADGASRIGERGTGEASGGTSARTMSRCGPELASPGGVEAQTCVLTRGGLTWARTYYRNATGEKLTSVLTLMAPGGRTVQTNCDAEAGDEPRTCETPREPSRGAASAYSAVAEFAAHDGTGDGPLLLRSGSNSPQRGGR
ncbi:hypothetical protein OGH68_18220 [Streptomyces peucetius]|uniref:Serine/threonine protein kinase n=1 Tax=Streptomyces peucetius TaxID=1950 RepID=A0ABY6IB63_STRPE|nr:hypothetical protein OGH68_18220 [Streptomyces peucetius]